jgi:hypothetical protein
MVFKVIQTRRLDSFGDYHIGIKIRLRRKGDEMQKEGDRRFIRGVN